MIERAGVSSRPLRVIYISPNGIGTPLVRSQVLPYLRGLTARRCAEFRLVTFERGDPVPAGEFITERWHGLRPYPGGHMLAKVGDVVRGAALVLRLALRERPDVLHARSYLPAAIAAIVGLVVRSPYVFDMRGFLGDEYVEGGHWLASDLRYRVLRIAERVLLRGAAAIVVLTERAAERLRAEPRYAPYSCGKPIVVVPCAVDLVRFRPPAVPASHPTLVYSGSLGMWYLLPEMLRVYRAARARMPDLRFLILNRGERGRIASALEQEGLGSAPVEVRSVAYEAMPAALAEAHAGIALLRQVPSKLGSSPVKVAEYLACGLPVIVNRGVGDMDDLVARYGAGHVMQSFDEGEILRSAEALVALVADTRARENARRLAEEVFGIEGAVERYARLYANFGAGGGR